MHESESEVTQSCLTLSDPMNCSLPGSSFHGIFQARVLEWGAIVFSKYNEYSFAFHLDLLVVKILPFLYSLSVSVNIHLFCLYHLKTRPGADCGSDHELLIAKFRLKWKKVGKTSRPFRYDLNQIPCGSGSEK